MKKLIGATLCLFLAFSAFAGEKFENIVGAGLTLPVSYSKDNTDNAPKGFDDKSITQVGLGANLFWVGIMKDMGLAFKADFTIDGFIKSEYDDVKMNIAGENKTLADLFDKKTAGAISLDVGAGYAFIRSDKFTLAAFGLLGVSASTNEYEATHDGNTVKLSFKSASFDFGADLFANYKIINGFGVYADLAFKGTLGSNTGSISAPMGPAGDTTASTIGFKFAPTIGASFAF